MAKKSFVAILLCMALAFVLFACASTGEPVEGPVTYNEVVDVADFSTADLFTKVNMWFVDAFKNADSVIQFSDKESGTIKGKYVSDIALSSYQQYQVTTIITVEIKDSKYRISFTDPTYREYQVNGYGVRMGGFSGVDKHVAYQAMADKLNEEWTVLAKSLKDSVQSSSGNW